MNKRLVCRLSFPFLSLAFSCFVLMLIVLECCFSIPDNLFLVVNPRWCSHMSILFVAWVSILRDEIFHSDSTCKILTIYGNVNRKVIYFYGKGFGSNLLEWLVPTECKIPLTALVFEYYSYISSFMLVWKFAVILWNFVLNCKFALWIMQCASDL